MTHISETLDARIERLSNKYHLHSHSFDAECLYEKGDLSSTMREFLSELLPEEEFSITETLSEDSKQYVAKIDFNQKEVGVVASNIGGDYLPDSFYSTLEEIPIIIGSSKRICMINPRLFGQEGCYISGTEKDLLAAKKDGLPLVFSHESVEDMMKADISEFE